MAKQRLKVLITVKTAPIPSKKYDELVCTAGVLEDGTFVRLYPINFRELPFSQQYRKYQWIEVDAEKHKGRDTRKESWKPDSDTLTLGPKISTAGDPTWSNRARHVLPKKAQSMEALWDAQELDRTSLGVFKPQKIHDLVIEELPSPDWDPSFLEALKQARLWDDRKHTREPPRRMPFKLSFKFECDDPRCKGNHQMMIEDWEVSALYWRLVDEGVPPQNAVQAVRTKFLTVLCALDRDTHFFVGTVLEHGTWVVIGIWWPALPKPAAQRKLSF